jgi:non-ribosomal peptide synthetase component E (peptide arylation enzyme)
MSGATTSGGHVPYPPEAAALYADRRWWLGFTMGDLLDRAADIYPRREALVGDDAHGRQVRYTYAGLRAAADTFAVRLLDLGLEPGDRALLQLPNYTDFVVAYFGLQKAGLVSVLLTVNHTAREVGHLAKLTQPRAWILPSEYRGASSAPLVEGVRETVSGLDVVIAAGTGLDSCVRLDDLLAPSAGGDDAGEEQAQQANRVRLAGVRPDPTAVCQILPSGGTTGLPKGAPRTHNDYICNVEYKSKAWDLNATDTCLVATTVGHNLALLVTVSGSVFHGAKMVMLDSTRPQDFCAAVQEERVTCTGLVPTLISRIVSYEGLDGFDLSSLQRVYVGAANSPPDLVLSVESKLGARYVNAFGMVEGPCSQSRPDDSLDIRCQTIGRPICPYDTLVTLDAEGNRTPPGVEGELAAKGPGVFTGYWENQAANQQAFTPDGFFRTGDLAVIDAQGIIRITGRLKDIIIRGGENIAARDVEDLISAHPSVEYVAVIGLPDPDLGEIVCAVIRRVEGSSLSGGEVEAHLVELEAARALVPARIEFMEDIPLTAAGKADKKLLKTMLASG